VALCRDCPIGAANAGVAVRAPQATASAKPMHICPRCGRVGCQRLIPSRGICVSCYNREREIERGRDRRGHIPRRPALVPTLTLLNDGGETVARAAVGIVELSLWVLHQGARSVSRAGVRDDVLSLIARQESLSRWVPHGGPMQIGLWPGLDYRQPRTMRGSRV
jgi:hypothetical protein